MLILKIGGSLFSDKRLDRVLNESALKIFACQVAELAALPGGLIVVIGGGSFCHGAMRKMNPTDRHGALLVTEANFALKWQWTVAFREAGIPAVPLQLAACASIIENGPVLYDTVIRQLVEADAVPVLSGDCLLAPDGSLRVLGSDHVAALLRTPDGPCRIAVLTDVPGILVDGPRGSQVLPWIDPCDVRAAYGVLDEAPSWDGTGAMVGKLDALLDAARAGAECVILRGDPDADSIRFLRDPVETWPSDVEFTLIRTAPLALAR